MMSRIRGNNTKPETLLRGALHAKGFRFRLNVRGLPGSPDIVLPKWRTAIFVHGCFWHRHTGCPKAATPKSNVAFWQEKFAANMRRDAEAIQRLHDLGWRTLVVWECTVGSDVDEQLIRELADFIRWSGEYHGEF